MPRQAKDDTEQPVVAFVFQRLMAGGSWFYLDRDITRDASTASKVGSCRAVVKDGERFPARMTHWAAISAPFYWRAL